MAAATNVRHDMTNTDIPAGFEPHFRKGPLTDPWEPLYSRKTDKAVIMGLRLARPHTNGRGLIHGGLIAALADNAMGYSCAQATGWTTSFVTISLTVDFVGSARDRPVARGRERRDPDRQDDLFRAVPVEGRRRRDRARQRDISRGAEEGIVVMPRLAKREPDSKIPGSVMRSAPE